MSDPLVYLQAIVASAGVSAFLAIAIGGRQPSAARWNTACVVAISGGVAIGCYLLRLRIHWPPVNALDRLMTIVLPAALVTEWIVGRPSAPRWLGRLLRIVLVITAGRILLHGSVYLGGREWTMLEASAALVVCALSLAALWMPLDRLSARSGGASIALALALTIPCAGMVIALAGYLSGGAASLPLTGAFLGTIVASYWLTAGSDVRPIVGIGVVGLFGLLFVGLFFGRLSTAGASAMLFAPLLCWVTELPAWRCRSPWLIATMRLLIVAIPLAVVLGLAICDFQRHTAPLLGR